MYSDAFCRVYNAFGWNYFPEAFGAQLLDWIAEKQLHIRTCLDLGCGTGVLCETLRNGGIDAAGVDLSENMIAIARARNPEIRYEVGDMVTYRLPQSVDLVTCTGDALNHILRLEDVARIFANVHESLNPGGWFVFDLLNEREIAPDEPIDLDFDEATRAQLVMRRAADDVVELCVTVREAGKPPFEEVITEVVHDPEVILGLLRDCGFRVERCAHQLSDASEGRGLTWFIIAQKI